MTRTDKILDWIGLSRKEQVRKVAQTAFVRGARSYAAGVLNNLTLDWSTTQINTNGDVRNYLAAVRERARDLAKNSAFGKRFLNLCRVNIVGPFGFKLQMNVQQWNPETKEMESDKIANDKIEKAWDEWCKPENCTTSGRYSFREVCNLIVEGKKRDGEAPLIRFVRSKNSLFRFQLEVIPIDALDEKLTQQNGDNTVIMGVEMDKARRPVNYYIRKYEPETDMYGLAYGLNNYDVISAEDVIHYFKYNFQDQTRGISEMAPAMLPMHNQKGYNEATVFNARFAANKGILYETDKDAPNQYQGDDTDANGNVISTIELGTGEQLPPGVKPFLMDPVYPTAQYEMFNKANLKEVSAGWNVAYASLSNDLSEGNYGSNRVGLLDERANWEEEQQEFREKILTRIFTAWLEMALLKAIDLPGYRFEKFNKPIFTGRRWAWIDPESDLAALQEELYLKIKSPFDAAAERGDDLEQIYKDFSEAKKLAEKYGITVNYDDPKGKAAGQNVAKTGDPKEKETTKSYKLVTNGNGVHN